MNRALQEAMRWHPREDNKGEGGEGGGGAKKEEKGGGGDGDLGTIEERATRMGWKPEASFKGDKTKFVDAATFVKNGEESLPVLRERLRTLEHTNIALGKSVKEVRDMNERTFTRALEQARKEVKAEIAAAAAAGDGKAASEALEKSQRIEEEAANRKTKAQEDPEFEAWSAQNAWYQDPELKVEAEVIAFRLRRVGEKAEGTAFLEKVKAEMKKQFPDRFGNPRKEASDGGVERPGAGDGGNRGAGVKGWDKLPAAAKEAGSRFIAQKLFKDKAAYAAAYFSDPNNQ